MCASMVIAVVEPF